MTILFLHVFFVYPAGYLARSGYSLERSIEAAAGAIARAGAVHDGIDGGVGFFYETPVELFVRWEIDFRVWCPGSHNDI